MGEFIDNLKEAVTGAALKVGVMERVREDGTPVRKPKKNTPAKKQGARRRRLSRAEITARAKAKAERQAKAKAERAAKIALRRQLRISQRPFRLTPRMPRLR